MNGFEGLGLDGKVLLVSGAARGIGRAIAELLARRGAKVAMNDLRADDVGQAAEEMERENLGVRAFPTDVTDPQAVERLVDEVAAWGGGLDGLVNNAGIGGTGSPLSEIELVEWQAMLAADLTSVFLMCRGALRHLREGGAIVNISSITALMGVAGSTHYAAAKAGVIGFSKSLARELAPQGIRVNVVAPGLIDTEMSRRRGIDHQSQLVLLPRIGEPVDIAQAVAFLLAPASSFVTGQVLGPNGGAYM
ncbi:MAG: SDR family NAD(P)-dependent oxidoreductase [Thermaerobacter sp.]|nr:SDR family NAD(P)-dependent oxidoreductase [Thermaerobacter sp.]